MPRVSSKFYVCLCSQVSVLEIIENDEHGESVYECASGKAR